MGCIAKYFHNWKHFSPQILGCCTFEFVIHNYSQLFLLDSHYCNTVVFYNLIYFSLYSNEIFFF